MRGRLVAKEVKRTAEDDLFAGTPPLEAKKALCSMVVTGTKRSKEPLKLLFVPVRFADCYADAKKPAVAQQPEEYYEPDVCGEMHRSM